MVPREADMNVVPHTWVFRIKELNADGSDALHKARCVIRGDKQQPGVDFVPESTYAPVASHEAIRLIISV